MEHECLTGHFIAAKLGECQPPASKTFRPTAETLFVFLPEQPAMSPRWQLLWRARNGNMLGTGQSLGHPHPSPALGNGLSGDNQHSPKHRNWSQTLTQPHSYTPIPKSHPQSVPSPWTASDLRVSQQSRFKILVCLPSSSPCCAGLPRGDSEPGELAQPGGHLLSSHGHAAWPELVTALCIGTFGTEQEREEGKGPRGLKAPLPHRLEAAATP